MNDFSVLRINCNTQQLFSRIQIIFLNKKKEHSVGSVGQCVIDIYIYSNISYATTFQWFSLILAITIHQLIKDDDDNDNKDYHFSQFQVNFNSISSSSTVFTRKIIDEKMINCFVLVLVSISILFYFQKLLFHRLVFIVHRIQ